MKKYLLLSLSAIFIAHGTFTNGQTKTIQIMHWNDVNGQVEKFMQGTSNSSAAPTPCPTNTIAGCVGGAINLVNHLVKDSSSADYSLRLTSGDLVGGESGWMSIIGWRNYANFISDHLKPDVVALGMKEFGAGVNRTLDFINGANAETENKIVISNTCAETYAPDTLEAKFCSQIQNVKVITLDGNNIGVVGFVTQTVEKLSLPGKLKFWDPADKIAEAISANKDNIKTYIAIGDGNEEMAKKILDQNPKIKLVIYGSGLSNTKDMTGQYPEVYQNRFIATAGRYGSSIGKLIFIWNTETGDLSLGSGSQLYPTTTVEYGEEANDAMRSAEYRGFLADVQTEKEMLLGHSRVTLHGGEKCWRQECNLGNLVTDAMVHCALIQPPITKPFPYPIHSIWHGGAFFEDDIKPAVSISKFDVHKWLPYHNRAHLVKVLGSNLRKVFQESAEGIDPKRAGVNDWGQFLQVSDGMEVHYEAASTAPKLTRLRMTIDVGGIPQKEDLQDNLEYYLVIPTYLYEGRGVYEVAKGIWTDVNHENVTSNLAFDDDCVESYVRALRQISIGFEERIWINRDSGGDETSTTIPSTDATTPNATSTGSPLPDSPSTSTDNSRGESNGSDSLLNFFCMISYMIYFTICYN